MELPHLDFGNHGKSPLNDAMAAWLAGLAQRGAEGQGWEQAGNSAPSVPLLPRAQPCCRAWHLPVLKVPVCARLDEKPWDIPLWKRINVTSLNTQQTKTKQLQKSRAPKLITLPAPQSTLPLDPFQLFPPRGTNSQAQSLFTDHAPIEYFRLS